jgi:hypothetical protein
MISVEEKKRLGKIVEELGLARIFTNQDWLVGRLDAFCREYVKYAAAAPEGAIPESVSIAELIQATPGEIDMDQLAALLQAAAFLCTPPFLAMIWMIEMGAEIRSTNVRYELRGSVEITVLLGFGTAHTNTILFQSTELWDLAFFRLVGMSKADEQPVLSGVYPLRLR